MLLFIENSTLQMKQFNSTFQAFLTAYVFYALKFVWFDSLHLSQQFFSYAEKGLRGLNQLCLAQGHNAMTLVRLERPPP